MRLHPAVSPDEAYAWLQEQADAIASLGAAAQTDAGDVHVPAEHLDGHGEMLQPRLNIP